MHVSPSERRMVPAANSCRRAPAQLSRIEAIAIGFRCATICGAVSGRLVGLTAEYPISRFCARRVSLAQASSAHTGEDRIHTSPDVYENGRKELCAHCLFCTTLSMPFHVRILDRVLDKTGGTTMARAGAGFAGSRSGQSGRIEDARQALLHGIA